MTEQETNTILVVEDEPPILETIADILALGGYRVLCAEDGQEAIDVLQSDIPDLIVSDVMMPHVDGYTLLNMVRDNSKWADIPFIFLTARGTVADVRRGFKQGVDHYIVKPFEPEDLLVAVQSRLERIQQIRASVGQDIEHMKSQILDVISHELRTPLSYIYGSVMLLKEQRDDLSEEEQQEFFEALHLGSERLTRLVEDLLLLVRIDSGAVELEIQKHKSRCDLRSLVQDVFHDLSDTAAANQVELANNVPPDLWLLCNRNHFMNALGRIVENGIKFTGPRGGHVLVNAVKEDGCVRVDVVDNGIGISEEKQDRLFERFEQIDRSLIEQQGTGVGLAIARAIIELHGGDIEVESKPDEGSTFKLTLR